MAAKTLQAKVTFMTPSEGARRTAARTGIRPHLALGDVLTSCVVRSVDGREELELGVEQDVTIEIVFWDEYGRAFDPKSEVKLFDGSRQIARGRWV